MEFKRNDIVQVCFDGNEFNVRLLKDVTEEYKNGTGRIWKVKPSKHVPAYFNGLVKFQGEVVFSSKFFVKKIGMYDFKPYYPEWL